MRPSITLVSAAMLLSLAACDGHRANAPVGGGGVGGAGTMALAAAAGGGMGALQPEPTALDSDARTPLELDATIPDSGDDMTAAAADAGDASLVANDATTDSGASASACTFEAKLSPRCTASLCTYEGDTFVAVRSTENLRTGALAWSASVCERVLGWASAGSDDGTLFIYGLSLEDLRELQAGAPVFLYYAGPSEPPTMEEAEECPLERSQQIPVCPATSRPPKHHSKLGCRGPLDPNCAACEVEPNLFLTSTGGADWYNSSAVFRPTGCVDPGYCLGCASCSYRDEDEARALGERPECEPCPTEAGVDACFDPDGCECWCSARSRLRAACPTVVP